MIWMADLVLAALVLEGIVLLGFGRRLLAPRDAIGLLLPGAALAVALRLAMDGGGLAAIGAALAAALGGHVYDLQRRIGRRGH